MITVDVLEPVYGPLPIPAEVVHYNGTLLIGRDMALWPGLFQTESDVVRYNLQRALAQVEHSTTEAPEQVEHWHWVAESYRRDLVGVPSLTDIEGGPYPSSIHPEAEDIDVDALTEAWLVEQHQHVRVVLDNAGISETLPWDDLSERTKRLRRNQARPVVEFVAARVEQDVRRQIAEELDHRAAESRAAADRVVFASSQSRYRIEAGAFAEAARLVRIDDTAARSVPVATPTSEPAAQIPATMMRPIHVSLESEGELPRVPFRKLDESLDEW